MKKYACFISLLFVMPIASGQTKPIPKTRQGSTIPTQKEMQDLMKDAQKELDNLDPSTKRMMDSLGIKIPSLNNIPQVTDAQLQIAFRKRVL